jgi:predicted GNAT family acetyltransferase
VYIARPVRGEGLGTALTNAVCAYLEPFGLRRVLLATADAQEVYARVGFAPLASPGKWMVLGDE